MKTSQGYLVGRVDPMGVWACPMGWVNPSSATRSTLCEVNYCVVLQARTVVPRFYGTAKKNAPVEPSINKNQVILSQNRRLTTNIIENRHLVVLLDYTKPSIDDLSVLCIDRGTEHYKYHTSCVTESVSRTSILV